MSSSLQCLKHTQPLWDYMEQNEFEDDINPDSKGDIIRALCRFLHTLHGEGLCVSPFQFKKTIDSHTTQFSVNTQCDAHEFLTFLLDKLYEEVKKESSPTTLPESRIEETFYGKFKSTVECLECHRVSVTREPYMCVSLPIDGAVEELPLLLHTKSQHLFYLTCKFDDESISIGVLKAEIKKQLIVSELDIYILIDNHPVELLPDAMQLSQILGADRKWDMYAIERDTLLDPGNLISLIKLDIGKSNPPLLLSSQIMCIDNPDLFKIDVKKLVAGPFATESDLSSSLYNFTMSRTAAYTNSGIAYGHIELRPTNRNSHFNDLLKKLPNRSIEIIRHREGEDYGTLQGCLKNFTNIERLQGANQWACEICGKFTDAYKKIEYDVLPRILIVHLKRFKVRCKKNRIKIGKLIKFPQVLEMSTVNATKHTYSLYAIINHVGEIERGHYTAYCRSLVNRSEWLLFDDNKVMPVDAAQLETCNSYVLFYEMI